MFAVVALYFYVSGRTNRSLSWQRCRRLYVVVIVFIHWASLLASQQRTYRIFYQIKSTVDLVRLLQLERRRITLSS